ncbi:hypothetical protein TNCT_445981 [Trichonephila clavata]|uniref:Uncharacterized protein n=1 Tax=Trichonephila clavata TaxID=2740835 RepID=A0A8X6LJ81_TRICU|nr:hypothetical protein TNCT_445981 [Trichonephila clavata]
MQIGNQGKASTPFGENYPYYPTSLVANGRMMTSIVMIMRTYPNSSVRSWKFLEMITTSSRVPLNSQRKSHLLEHLTLHSKEDSSEMLRCSWMEAKIGSSHVIEDGCVSSEICITLSKELHELKMQKKKI